MIPEDPRLTVTEPTFTASFLIGINHEDDASLDNVDVFVILPDGSNWSLTIFSVDEVARLLARWKETGEVANGAYLSVVHHLIVPKPGLSAMTTALRELVASGDLARVAARCDDSEPD